MLRRALIEGHCKETYAKFIKFGHTSIHLALCKALIEGHCRGTFAKIYKIWPCFNPLVGIDGGEPMPEFIKFVHASDHCTYTGALMPKLTKFGHILTHLLL